MKLNFSSQWTCGRVQIVVNCVKRASYFHLDEPHILSLSLSQALCHVIDFANMSPHLKKMKSHREELLDDSIFGPRIKTQERGKHKEIECSEKREKLHDLLKT